MELLQLIFYSSHLIIPAASKYNLISIDVGLVAYEEVVGKSGQLRHLHDTPLLPRLVTVHHHLRQEFKVQDRIDGHGDGRGLDQRDISTW